jgi:hypothetical protein
MGLRSRSCGQLPDPYDCSSDGDDGEKVSGGFLVSCGDTSELFEAAEAAFDEMTLGVEVLVERILHGSRRVVGDDGEGALGGDGVAEVIRVISGVGHHHFCREPLDQGAGLGRVALLAGRQDEADRTSQTSDGQVYFGAQAAARTSKRLILNPFFWAPLAC